jgi:hypothetical protein
MDRIIIRQETNKQNDKIIEIFVKGGIRSKINLTKQNFFTDNTELLKFSLKEMMITKDPIIREIFDNKDSLNVTF